MSDQKEIDQQNLLALGDDEPILDAWDAAVEQSLPYRYTITSYGADYPRKARHLGGHGGHSPAGATWGPAL